MTRTITFNGKTLTIAQWAKELGIAPATLRDRLNQLRWPLEKALTTPNQKRRREERQC